MLINPPFLPSRPQNTADATWIRQTLSGDAAGSGAYPLSHDLGWHGGIHVNAPISGTTIELVRAIADGTVIFKRNPTPRIDDLTHPLNYRGGWTDDGCVVIRHETDIGEGPQATGIVFFSVYMHLFEIRSSVRLNQKIYRKDEIGQAGDIYAATGRKIHFEIVCDDENLRKLIGRDSGKLNHLVDGRGDAVYGELYYFLPSGTKIYANKPLLNSPTTNVPPVHVTETDFVVGLRFSGGAGLVTPPSTPTGLPTTSECEDALLTTYNEDGAQVGQPQREINAEYELYTHAELISKAYPASTRPVISAVYELLRFGRVIGADTLEPADVPHWRKVSYPNGTGWVNLNASGLKKFSDADFPCWKGWTIVDDSADGDSRSDSSIIRKWIDANSDGKITSAEAMSRLGDTAIRQKLARTICKFPSEWDANTIDARWGWLKTQSDSNPAPLDEESFTDLKKHIQALCIASPELLSAQWHFDPKEFITHFRQCGWMSLREMTQMLPSKSVAGGTVSWDRATERFELGDSISGAAGMPSGLFLAINQGFRKYCMAASRLRQSHFFSQVLVETGGLKTNVEIGNDRYFRTMYEVITEAEAGEDYDNAPTGIAWRLRMVYHKVNGQDTLYTRPQYMSTRPGKVQTKAHELGNTHLGDGPRFKGRGLIQLTGFNNYASYGTYRGRNYTAEPNHNLLAIDAFISSDLSFKYWVSKFRHGININRHADKGTSDNVHEQVTRAVNGGTAHIAFRREYFGYVWGLLHDEPTPADTNTLKRQKE